MWVLSNCQGVLLTSWGIPTLSEMTAVCSRRPCIRRSYPNTNNRIPIMPPASQTLLAQTFPGSNLPTSSLDFMCHLASVVVLSGSGIKAKTHLKGNKLYSGAILNDNGPGTQIRLPQSPCSIVEAVLWNFLWFHRTKRSHPSRRVGNRLVGTPERWIPRNGGFSGDPRCYLMILYS